MAPVDYALAAGGGVVSFLSPCVLPLVPVYLSVSTGLDPAELASGGRRETALVLRRGGLFIAGFSGVFVALGSSATALGSVLASRQVPLARVGGLLVTALALLMIASTRWSGGVLGRELRFHPRVQGSARPREAASSGPGTRVWRSWGPAVSGAALAFGWTPCIGPVLGSVLTVAAGEGGAGRGAALLLLYSAGLGVPFLLTGLVFSRGLLTLRRIRRRSPQIVQVSALVLAAYGVLLSLDRLSWVTSHLQQAAFAAHLGRLVTLG
jgi:cytochrome c-type biogenesis protein